MLDTNTRYSFILACNKALEEKPLSCAIAVALSDVEPVYAPSCIACSSRPRSSAVSRPGRASAGEGPGQQTAAVRRPGPRRSPAPQHGLVCCRDERG